MKKTLFFVIGSICVAILLGGCGGNTSKNEVDLSIKKDANSFLPTVSSKLTSDDSPCESYFTPEDAASVLGGSWKKVVGSHRGNTYCTVSYINADNPAKGDMLSVTMNAFESEDAAAKNMESESEDNRESVKLGDKAFFYTSAYTNKTNLKVLKGNRYFMLDRANMAPDFSKAAVDLAQLKSDLTKVAGVILSR